MKEIKVGYYENGNLKYEIPFELVVKKLIKRAE